MKVLHVATCDMGRDCTCPYRLTEPQWRALLRANRLRHVYTTCGTEKAPWKTLLAHGLVRYSGAGFSISDEGRRVAALAPVINRD